MPLELRTASRKQTQRAGALLGALLQAGDVLLLEGPLGSGKTTLTQGIAEGMGLEAVVTSPTFILANQYPGRLPLFHIDLYRIESMAEALDLGLDDYFYDGGVSVVEWPDRAPEALPLEHLWVTLAHAGRDRRVISMTARGHRYEELLEELEQRLRSAGDAGSITAPAGSTGV